MPLTVLATRRDTLIVVVPTLGRNLAFPAFERALRSYCAHLPGHFDAVRIDVVIKEGCEASARIEELARDLRRVRVLTVPAWYEGAGDGGFKERANQFAQHSRIAQGEERADIRVLHLDESTAVGPEAAAALAQAFRMD